MTDDTNEIEMTEEEQQAAYELDSLKAKADLLGVKYTKNIGAAKLRARIENHLAAQEDDEEEEEIKPKKGEKTRAEIVSDRKNKASKLIRIRVTCMNPNKKGWHGEIFSVGSAKMGTFKKFVPFNADDGWHVPQIIYEAIKDRKFSTFKTEKTNKGQTVRKAHLVPEYSVEVLPDLTKEELETLAKQQAMANG